MEDVKEKNSMVFVKDSKADAMQDHDVRHRDYTGSHNVGERLG